MSEDSERKEIILRNITQVLTSETIAEKTLLKSPELIKSILKKKINQELKNLKMKRPSPEEVELISSFALIVSKRDDKIFEEICHRLRNRLMTLGGFATRVNKIAIGINEFAKKSSRIQTDSTTLIDEIKRTEREIKNKKRNRSTKG